MTPFALAPSLDSLLTRRGTHARILTAQPSYVPVRKPTCEHRPSLSLLGLCETRTSHACLSSTTQARRRHTQVQVYARTTSAPAFRCGEREEAVMLICLPALWMREGDGARVRLSGAHVFPSRYGWPLVSPYSGKRAQERAQSVGAGMEKNDAGRASQQDKHRSQSGETNTGSATDQQAKTDTAQWIRKRIECVLRKTRPTVVPRVSPASPPPSDPPAWPCAP